MGDFSSQPKVNELRSVVAGRERQITPDEAKEIAFRLIAGAFGRTDLDKRPRFSIPCKPWDDDDCLMIEYVKQTASLKSRLEQAERAVDVLESKARIQAKLLADTGRRAEEMEGALRPFLAVAKVMDFYTEESMPVMIFPRPECESQYPDEPRCAGLTTANFHRLAALEAKPAGETIDSVPSCGQENDYRRSGS